MHFYQGHCPTFVNTCLAFSYAVWPFPIQSQGPENKLLPAPFTSLGLFDIQSFCLSFWEHIYNLSVNLQSALTLGPDLQCVLLSTWSTKFPTYSCKDSFKLQISLDIIWVAELPCPLTKVIPVLFPPIAMNYASVSHMLYHEPAGFYLNYPLVQALGCACLI